VLGGGGVVHGWNVQCGGVPVADQGEVVDPGRRRRVGAGLGFGARVDVAADLMADRDTHAAVLVADLEVAQVEGVEDELDAASDQGGVDFVGVAVQRHRRGLGDQASLGPQERLMQGRRGRQHGRVGGREPGQWCLAGLGMDALVVQGFDPGGEQLVHLRQGRDLGQCARDGELDQELLTDRAEDPFDLSPAGGFPRFGMGQLDTQDRQRPHELFGDHRRPVVEVMWPAGLCGQ
jgi:hypothetical protein